MKAGEKLLKLRQGDEQKGQKRETRITMATILHQWEPKASLNHGAANEKNSCSKVCMCIGQMHEVKCHFIGFSLVWLIYFMGVSLIASQYRSTYNIHLSAGSIPVIKYTGCELNSRCVVLNSSYILPDSRVQHVCPAKRAYWTNQAADCCSPQTNPHAHPHAAKPSFYCMWKNVVG